MGFLVSVWSGSRALGVVIDTVSIMYGLGGRRGIVRTRALSLVLYVRRAGRRRPRAAAAPARAGPARAFARERLGAGPSAPAGCRRCTGPWSRSWSLGRAGRGLPGGAPGADGAGAAACPVPRSRSGLWVSASVALRAVVGGCDRRGALGLRPAGRARGPARLALPAGPGGARRRGAQRHSRRHRGGPRHRPRAPASLPGAGCGIGDDGPQVRARSRPRAAATSAEPGPVGSRPGGPGRARPRRARVAGRSRPDRRSAARQLGHDGEVAALPVCRQVGHEDLAGVPRALRSAAAPPAPGAGRPGASAAGPRAGLAGGRPARPGRAARPGAPRSARRARRAGSVRGRRRTRRTAAPRRSGSEREPEQVAARPGARAAGRRGRRRSRGSGNARTASTAAGTGPRRRGASRHRRAAGHPSGGTCSSGRRPRVARSVERRAARPGPRGGGTREAGVPSTAGRRPVPSGGRGTSRCPRRPAGPRGPWSAPPRRGAPSAGSPGGHTHGGPERDHRGPSGTSSPSATR